MKLNNVLIITHSFVVGPTQELRDYLKDKVNKLLFIEHPFSYCADTRSSMTLYQKGVERRKGQKRGQATFSCPDRIVDALSVTPCRAQAHVRVPRRRR